MSRRVAPEGFNTLTPHLVFRGAAEAIDFYKIVFGAEETYRVNYPDSKKIMHATVRFGDSNMMLADEMEGHETRAPRGDSGTILHLYVEDTDQTFHRALQRGSRALMHPQDMFWGDRYCQIEDPFGHRWALATKIRTVSGTELDKSAREFFRPNGQAKK